MKTWGRQRIPGVVTGPESAGGLVLDVLRRRGVRKELGGHRIQRQWQALVGARIAARCWPVPDAALKEGTLLVRVTNSSWMQELSFLTADLINKINEGLGADTVKAIRLQLGRRRPDDTGSADTGSAAVRASLRRAALPPAATGADLARIEHEAQRVSDPDLRAIIIAARRRLNV